MLPWWLTLVAGAGIWLYLRWHPAQGGGATTQKIIIQFALQALQWVCFVATFASAMATISRRRTFASAKDIEASRAMCCLAPVLRGCAVMLLTLVGNALAGFLVEGPYAYTISNDVATIRRFDKSYSGHLDITNSLGGYPVSEIAPTAFYSCPLNSIHIPPTITEIGTAAFNNCVALSNIAFSVGLKTVGNCTFGSCKSLKTVSIPEGTTNIGNFAFSGDTNIVEISLPASLSVIGRAPFCISLNLERITVAKDNLHFASIDGVLFDKALTRLIQYPRLRPGRSYSIPNSVFVIEEYAFFRCCLTNITFPASLMSIGREAFFNTDIMEVSLPVGVISVGDYAFQSCRNLTSVTVPASVCQTGFRAFAFCTRLSCVTLKEGIISIGDTVFKGCTNLSDIVVPASVTLVKKSAFDGCSGLKNIYFEGKPPVHQSPAFADVQATAYYLPGRTGWPDQWAGMATACLVPGCPDVSPAFFDGVGSAHTTALVAAIRNRLGNRITDADRRVADAFETADLMGLLATDLTPENITNIAAEIKISGLVITDDGGVVLTVTCRNGITSATAAVSRLLRNPGSRGVRVEVMDSLAPGSASVHITPVFSQTGDMASALFSPPPSPSQFYRISVRRSAGVSLTRP